MAERGVIVDEKFCFQQEIDLTVRKTSVFFPGDGFVVYDPDGDVIFRFDSYGPDSQPKDELVLMDASGKCLLSLRRKPGFDAAFAMGLVLVLDQIFGDDDRHEVDPTSENDSSTS
ncbi:hypothetical protein GH714_015583 [Hevea brasiliensis]|uniref:Uncharacterized protein n=1 Tax=Hevea brasiliensis TaxID=3981 RepID=A0A6A6MAD7_HEVBR|nr:hypothetical protein GH714_015583 [Hevea brasiliensis]